MDTGIDWATGRDWSTVIKTVDLERVDVGGEYRFNDEMLDDARVEFYVDHAFRQTVMRMRASVLGERLEPRKIEYPADWWQAFKARWFPRWALKRWPVVNTVVWLKAHLLYPGLKASIPNRNVRFLVQEDPYRYSMKRGPEDE